MHGREGGRHNQQQSQGRSMSAVFVTCALRSVKLPHRDTWLLAHLIHFSPVILRRWRTSRAPTPCPGRQCWCWISAVSGSVNDLGARSARIRHSSWSLAMGADSKMCPAHRGAQGSLQLCTADVWGWTPGTGETLENEIIPEPPVPTESCYKGISPGLEHVVIPSLKQPNHTKFF